MIGIICAMDKELQYFKNDIQDHKVVKVLNYEFVTGKINSQDIVIVKCGIGKVQSGIVTALMVENFHPTLIINSGIAGGFDKELKVFDIVCATKTGFYDIDFTAENHEFGSLNGENRFVLNDSSINNPCDLNIKYGLILSADLFATDRKRLDDIFNKYYIDEQVLAVDMESASIAKVCYDNNVKCVIIRSISDVVGMESQINSYWEFAAQAASNAYQLIKENYLK